MVEREDVLAGPELAAPVRVDDRALRRPQCDRVPQRGDGKLGGHPRIEGGGLELRVQWQTLVHLPP
jgi:hypothetical protein